MKNSLEQQSQSDIARRLHTVPDVAGVLGCSNDTVYNLIAKGALRAVRIGRHLKVDDRALDKFIERGGSQK